MLFSSLFVITAAATTALAHGSHLERKAAAAGPAPGRVYVTGAKGYGDGQVHTRLEINDMAVNEPEQFALLILAMSEWQSQPQQNITGYYQVAGIHGQPRINYDGVEQCSECSGAYGYCTHMSPLFPAWHRTLTALFEQEFLNVVQQVANSWSGSNKNDILSAAAVMRFPFWDWAAKPDANYNVLPSLVSSPQITILGPSGQQTVTNPLYSYHIPDDSAMYYSPFTTWPNTLRYPTSNAPSATSNEQSDTNAFNNVRTNLQDQVYALMTNCKDYNHFSHEGATGSTSCSNSLEGIHNTVHTTSGGPGGNGVSGGHMTYLPLAAFDPIFWLHHTNVDRLFALWQTINPNSYGASQAAILTTWTIAQGSVQGADSPLTPFRKDATSFWTTNEVRDWATTFSYTYPEFVVTDGSQSSIANLVQQLYGSNPTLTASSLSQRAEQSESTTNNTTSTHSASSKSSSSTHSTSTDATRVKGHPHSQTRTAGSQVSSQQVGLAHSSTASLPTTVSSTSEISSHASSVSSALQQPSGGLIPGAISSALGKAGLTVGLGSLTSTSKGGLLAPLLNDTSMTLSLGLPAPTGSLSSPQTLTNVSGTSQNEYSCNVQTPRFAYNVSYTVYVFDGEPTTQDTTQWVSDANCVGTLGILAGGMVNPDIISSGSVPLTRHLQGKVNAGALASMNSEDVTPYLKQNLGWKIVKEGAEIHPTELPNYRAAVFSGQSTVQAHTGMTQWTAWKAQVNATQGKAGGVQSEEEATSAWPDNTPSYGTPIPSYTPTTTAYECTETPAPYTPVASSPVQSYSTPSAYTPAPVPTSAESYTSSGVAAATGTSWAPSSYPSSSPITPYTGASTRISSSGIAGIAICAVLSMLLL